MYKNRDESRPSSKLESAALAVASSLPSRTGNTSLSIRVSTVATAVLTSASVAYVEGIDVR